ncbi:glycosyl transferase [filamentous cyanobacterium CCT1]|nr:glycosyl transferase [filamentous cyanobacterium CCT1]PSN79767.1 glycosyl transferase [filamentous cyanobacterium CCP4]
MTDYSSVAICIPTYNQSQYLAKSVISACQQTYPDVQVWVADDASTDDTPQVMEKLCQQYPQIRYHRQPQNMGIVGNNTWLLSQPQTDFIVRLDSDDLLRPHYVETLIALMQRYPNAGYAHSAVQEIDEHDRDRAVRRVFRTEEFQDAETALRASMTNYRVAANICMFRAEVLRELNYYKGRPEYTEDYDLSVRLADAGYGNVYCSEILSSYRVWTDSKGVRPRRKAIQLEGLTRIYEESLIPAFERRGWSIRPIQNHRRWLARRHAPSCFSPYFTQAEQAQLVELLKGLGDSFGLRLCIAAIRLGLGPFFRWQREADLALKGIAKGWLNKLRAPSDIKSASQA